MITRSAIWTIRSMAEWDKVGLGDGEKLNRELQGGEKEEDDEALGEKHTLQIPFLDIVWFLEFLERERGFAGGLQCR